MLRRPLILLVVLLAGLGLAAPADAFSTGYFAIASSSASGITAGHTGYGPGWVALTFDTNGQPHGPIIGYLFHDGSRRRSVTTTSMCTPTTPPARRA